MDANMLSKHKLINSLTLQLEKLDYQPTVFPASGAALVMHKKIEELVLSIGVEFSRHFEGSFTGSFYYSRSYLWAYVVREFPQEAYQRIGHFLNSDERASLLSREFATSGVRDAWWVGFTQESISSFMSAVELAEPRFLSQGLLRERLLNCESLNLHWSMMLDVAHFVAANETGFRASHQPARYPKGIPSEWFLAAERILVQRRPDVVNEEYVRLLGIDAWHARG